MCVSMKSRVKVYNIYVYVVVVVQLCSGSGCKSCGYYFVNGPHIVHTGAGLG